MHQQQQPKPSNSDFMTGIAASPPLSPPIPSSNATASGSGGGGAGGSSTPPDDRRSSSIAALRLKAREHELRLEMLRQNGHGDIIS